MRLPNSALIFFNLTAFKNTFFHFSKIYAIEYGSDILSSTYICHHYILKPSYDKSCRRISAKFHVEKSFSWLSQGVSGQCANKGSQTTVASLLRSCTLRQRYFSPKMRFGLLSWDNFQKLTILLLPFNFQSVRLFPHSERKFCCVWGYGSSSRGDQRGLLTYNWHKSKVALLPERIVKLVNVGKEYRYSAGLLWSTVEPYALWTGTLSHGPRKVEARTPQDFSSKPLTANVASTPTRRASWIIWSALRLAVVWPGSRTTGKFSSKTHSHLVLRGWLLEFLLRCENPTQSYH